MRGGIFVRGICWRILAGLFLTLSAPALEYPSNFHFVEVPDPLATDNPSYKMQILPVPAIGVPFFDEHFGTIKTRVTEIEGANGRHEYARFDPFNLDHSRIVLLREGGGWRVFRTNTMPYNTTASLVMNLDGFEPRWDATSASLIWLLEEQHLVTFNVDTGVRTVIKHFDDDPTIGPIITANPIWRVTTREEGEASLDKRYWAFMLQGNDQAEYRNLFLFTWDRQQDQVIAVRTLTAAEGDLIDWVGMSPSGQWVLIGADPNDTGTIRGLTLANRELTQFHLLGHGIGHQDLGFDSEGREVIVGQNARTDYIDLIPIDPATVPVGDPADYALSNYVRLIYLDYINGSPTQFHSGVHVSCNYPGWAVVSTHIAPGVEELNWLDRSLVLIKLDRAHPRVFYLAKIHNTAQEEPSRVYWEETHGAITTDGRKVVWASNWGVNVGVGDGQLFLMQLDMPPNWSQMRTAAHAWQLS